MFLGLTIVQVDNCRDKDVTEIPHSELTVLIGSPTHDIKAAQQRTCVLIACCHRDRRSSWTKIS